MKALTWTTPGKPPHWLVDTSDQASVRWEHDFRRRTWPHTNPRLVEVVILEIPDRRARIVAALWRALIWFVPARWLERFFERSGVRFGRSH